MNIQLVPNQLVAKTWPTVAHLFAQVEPHARGDWTVDQLSADLHTGRLGLVVAADGVEVKGAAAVSFQNRRNSRTAFITALAGTDISDETNFAELKKIFSQQGCTEIEAAMRESTFRLWSRFGFEEKYRIAGMKI